MVEDVNLQYLHLNCFERNPFWAEMLRLSLYSKTTYKDIFKITLKPWKPEIFRTLLTRKLKQIEMQW